MIVVCLNVKQIKSLSIASKTSPLLILNDPKALLRYWHLSYFSAIWYTAQNMGEQYFFLPVPGRSGFSSEVALVQDPNTLRWLQ